MLIGLGWNNTLFGKNWHLYHTGRNWHPSSPFIQVFFFVSQYVFVIFFIRILQHFLLCYSCVSYLFLLINKLHQARMVWNNRPKFQHHIMKDMLVSPGPDRESHRFRNERKDEQRMDDKWVQSPGAEELGWLDHTADSWRFYHDQYPPSYFHKKRNHLKIFTELPLVALSIMLHSPQDSWSSTLSQGVGTSKPRSF